jgi:hypothetical protein
VTDVGIYHTRWTGWGHKRASGRGSYYDGLGFLHRATMTIYRLRGRSYTRIHVRWDAVFAGALRPAGEHVFDVAVNVPAQAAAAITECGDYVPTGLAHGTWTGYWTFNPPGGFTPVTNLTTRRVRCSNARPFSLQVSQHSRRSYHGFSCKWKTSYESYDVRCTRGREVIHWQGGV